MRGAAPRVRCRVHPGCGACRKAGASGAAQRRLLQGPRGQSSCCYAGQAGCSLQSARCLMQQLLFYPVRPWNKKEKEKCLVAYILIIIIMTMGLMSMKSLLRGADSGFCCHTLAWFSFLEVCVNHFCQRLIPWFNVEYWLWNSSRQMFAIQTCEERVGSDNAYFWGSARNTFLE
ncbi:hypothetical protein E2562_038052, partial [Oryza meyeriana var. granulata]